MNVPPDYNRDRKNQTFTEVHGVSAKAEKRRDKNRKERRRNRRPSRFFKSNWAAYKHYELYDMVHSANVGDMSTRAGDWKKLAGKIEATTSDVQQVVERVLGTWRGEAAVRSAESNTRLMRWADDVSHITSQVAAGMSDYTDAIAKAQRDMPEPGFSTAEENFRKGYSIGTHGEPSTAVLLKALTSDGIVSHQESRARESKAVQVMQTYENQSEGVHDTMPDLPDAPGGPTEQPTWTPSPDSDPGPGPGPDQTQPGPGTGSAGGPGVPGTTTAAGFADPARAGGGGGPGSPGGFGGTGYGGGVGSLGSGGGDLARGGSGPGGLAGIGGMAGRPAGAPGAGALGARGAGAPGAFGGMPMGAGAQGDEDKEHKNKYDEGLDLFDDLPPAYPPVFGA